MTVWNGETYLRDALESVFQQQTRASWELIVVDDGSSDGSAELLRQYQASDRRVRLLQHPNAVNCGISASRNLALQHARAPVVGFLDCDDVFLPQHLDRQLALLSGYPEVAMVYASAERWVDHAAAFDRAAAERAWWGSNYIPPLVPPGCHGGILAPGTLLRWMLANESFAPCMCTVLVRRSAALAVNGFENAFHGLYDDQVFHAKLSSRFAVYANLECTARYRQHAASCCAIAHGTSGIHATEAGRFRAWVEQFAETSVV